MMTCRYSVNILVCFYVFLYHGGQNGQEERCRGDVAGTLGEGGDEEAEDDGDGPGRDGVERCHLSAEPAGQTGLLTTHKYTNTVCMK